MKQPAPLRDPLASTVPSLRRYPGTRSFEDTQEDRRLFRGRDSEMQDVCQRIVSHRIVVLYAASGTGKSSLLKAGIFPLLRERGYLPLSVRFAAHSTLSIPEQLVAEVARECDRQAAEVYDAVPDAESLFVYFQKAEFWGKDGPMVPVLVFDQFEELFYLHGESQRDALLRELASLVKGSAPASSGTTATAKAMSQPSAVAAMLSAGNTENLRLVISLREDAMGNLVALGSQIPGLMTNAFRLQPLSLESAKLAITIPATESLDSRYTPAFQCDEAAVEDLVAWLAQKARLQLADTAALAGAVESFVLQIFCERIEEHVIAQRARGYEGEFTIDFFPYSKSKERVLQAYYHRKFVQFLRTKSQRFSGNIHVGEPVDADGREIRRDGVGRPHPRLTVDRSDTIGAAREALLHVIMSPRLGWRLLKLLEDDLLTKDGRRQPGDRANLQRIRHLKDEDVALLETMRLVRTEPHGGTQLLNLSHDQLASAIYHNSILRQVRQAFYVWGTALVMLLLVVGWFWQLGLKRDALEATTVAERAKTAAEKASKELAIANGKTAELAKLTAQRAGTESEAISSLALAVQADPTDDETFYDLLGRVLNFELALPTRLWTGASVGGDCPNCSIEMDPDNRHFAVIGGDKVMVWDAGNPSSQRLWSVEISLPVQLAIGRAGKTLVGLAPERRSQEKKIPIRSQDDVQWQFVLAEEEEDEGELRPLAVFAPKEVGRKPIVELSPGARWIVVSAGSESSPIFLYERAHGIRQLPPLPREQATAINPSQSATVPVPAKINKVAFHPEDALLAIIDSDTGCWLWQPSSNNWHNIVQRGAEHVIFSPDGNWLAVLSDKHSTIWSTAAIRSGDWQSQELKFSAVGPAARTSGVSFSPNSQLVVTDDLLWKPGQDPNSQTATEFTRLLWEKQGALFSHVTRLHWSSRFYYSYRLSRINRDRPWDRVRSTNASVDAFRMVEKTGRWGLEDDRLIDLTGAIPSNRFRIFGQTSPIPEEMQKATPSVSVIWTQPVSDTTPPIVRQVLKDGRVAEWRVAASQRLRMDRQPLGGAGRQAFLASDGQSVVVWNAETREVWRADPGGPAPRNKPFVLAEGCLPLNLTGQWLVTRTAAEPVTLAVWDITSGRKVAGAIALPDKASVPESSTDVGVSEDGKYLAIAYELEDGPDNFVASIGLDGVPTASWSAPQPKKGPIDFIHGKMVASQLGTSLCQMVPIYPVGGESQTLPGFVRDNQQVFLDGSGERLTILTREREKLSAQRIFKKGRDWQLALTTRLAGAGEPSTLAESSDGQWLVGVEENNLLAWRLGQPNGTKETLAPLLKLKVRLDSFGSPSLSFCGASHRLAIGYRDEIALVDLDKWFVDASSAERQDFARFAASFAGITAIGSHFGESKEVAIEPASVLWNTFQPNKDRPPTPLSNLVKWYLEQAEVALPHPFAIQNLTDWAVERRNTQSMEGVRDALEVNPYDPVSLAMHGWLAAKYSKSNDAMGYWDASFYYALHQPNLNKSYEVAIYAFQAKAMNALKQKEKALGAIAAGEKAAIDGGAEVKEEWRALLQEAKAEAQRIQP